MAIDMHGGFDGGDMGGFDEGPSFGGEDFGSEDFGMETSEPSMDMGGGEESPM